MAATHWSFGTGLYWALIRCAAEIPFTAFKAENQPRPKIGQRFKNSDRTDRTGGYGRLGGCDGEGNGRSGS
ncbi:hypothetical protein DY000_02017670 [Brassica cretica]|uniref:Uncharacterized protein n=1 Tax=Brassica cretica TaxID=69181 RepID=A0ABQ7CNL2_BRACR|nr:hypothetical protein DY000_02017670 [Brassica cretica]